MTSEPLSRFRLGLRDAYARLAGVQSLQLPLGKVALELVAALPVSYAKRKERKYPLVLVAIDAGQVGSVIEMSRLMTETKELHEHIVVCVSAPPALAATAMAQALQTAVLTVCASHWRVDTSRVFSYSADPAVISVLAATAGGAVRPLAGLPPAAADDVIPALLRGLRAELASGGVYGNNVVPLRKPWIAALLGMLAPLMRGLLPKAGVIDQGVPHLLHSAAMDRHFEIFAAVPAAAAAQPQRRYPLLLVLDANIEFSTAAETAARLAAAGEIDELVVVGIGVPRALGHAEFGFRRFEEFSAPADGYGFDDDLGRIFRSLFAVRGQDARQRIGQAPAFYRFVVDELLPLLQAQLPIDPLQCGLLGHSAGGAWLGFALLQAGSPFNRYLSVSPGVGISDSWMLRQLPQRAGQVRPDARLFLCIGAEERDNAFNIIAGIPQTEHYAARLRELTGVDASYHCFPGTTHSSVYPPAVAMGLQQLYGRAAKESA